LDPDPDWSLASTSGSGSGKNEYGSETLRVSAPHNLSRVCNRSVIDTRGQPAQIITLILIKIVLRLLNGQYSVKLAYRSVIQATSLRNVLTLQN